MAESTQPYSEQYFDGRRCGRSGALRNANPFFSKPLDTAGRPEPEEVWRSKYDIWRQGWEEGNAAFQREGRET